MGMPIHVCTVLSLKLAKRNAIRKTQCWICLLCLYLGCTINPFLLVLHFKIKLF